MSEKTAFERFHLKALIIGTIVCAIVLQLGKWITSPPMSFEEFIVENKINDITYRGVGVFVNAREQTLNYSLSNDPSTYYTVKISGDVSKCTKNLLLSEVGYSFIDSKPLESPLTKPGLEKEKSTYLIEALCAVDRYGSRSDASQHSYNLEKNRLPDMSQIKFAKMD